MWMATAKGKEIETGTEKGTETEKGITDATIVSEIAIAIATVIETIHVEDTEIHHFAH